MDYKIYKSEKDKDGVITVYIDFIDDDTGKVLIRTPVSGKTEDDFEIAIEKKKLKIEQEQLKINEYELIVMNAINKIKEKI